MHSSRIRIYISLKKHTGPKLLNVSVYFQMNCGGSINNELISNILFDTFLFIVTPVKSDSIQCCWISTNDAWSGELRTGDVSIIHPHKNYMCYE